MKDGVTGAAFVSSTWTLGRFVSLSACKASGRRRPCRVDPAIRSDASIDVDRCGGCSLGSGPVVAEVGCCDARRPLLDRPIVLNTASRSKSARGSLKLLDAALRGGYRGVEGVRRVSGSLGMKGGGCLLGVVLMAGDTLYE